MTHIIIEMHKRIQEIDSHFYQLIIDKLRRIDWW